MALLVKALPWIGVCTSMSCHGHGLTNFPKIWFYGYYHGRWCEVVFEQLFADFEIAKMWRFWHGSRNGDWASAKWQIDIPGGRQFVSLKNPSDEKIIDSYRNIEETFLLVEEETQMMARHLFDAKLCERIRDVRQRAKGPKDLSGLLEQCLANRTQ